MRLYFFFMDGCPACESAKPPLAQFEKKNPDVTIHRIDLLDAKWVHPWKPRATPTYVLEEPGYERVAIEGTLNGNELGQFMAVARKKMGIR